MNGRRRYYFLEIAETKNVTHAAARLRVSQPSLTQYLNRIEEELGVKLVDRNYTPLRLTKAGTLYHEYLLEAKRREDQFLLEIDNIKQENNKPLRIGVPVQGGNQKLNNSIHMFCMQNLQVDVQILGEHTSTIQDDLSRGKLDIGFGYTTQIAHEGLTTQIIRKERLVIVCNKNSPVVQRRKSTLNDTLPIIPEQLSGLIFYQKPEENNLFTVEKEHMEKHGVKPWKRIVMSNVRNMIHSILQDSDLGFAYLPDYMFEDPSIQENCDKLAFLRLGSEDIPLYFSMWRNRNIPQTKSARIFWNYIRKNCCESSES